MGIVEEAPREQSRMGKGKNVQGRTPDEWKMMGELLGLKKKERKRKEKRRAGTDYNCSVSAEIRKKKRVTHVGRVTRHERGGDGGNLFRASLITTLLCGRSNLGQKKTEQLKIEKRKREEKKTEHQIKTNLLRNRKVTNKVGKKKGSLNLGSLPVGMSRKVPIPSEKQDRRVRKRSSNLSEIKRRKKNGQNWVCTYKSATIGFQCEKRR